MATTKKTSRGRKTTSPRTTTRKKATTRQRGPASKRPAKMVYFFGGTRTEGKASQKTLLGGKGANLADMTSIGLPVPAGFTITTNSCEAYYDVGGRFPEGLSDQIRANVRKLEKFDAGGKIKLIKEVRAPVREFER